jgi:hypothetical protein
MSACLFAMSIENICSLSTVELESLIKNCKERSTNYDSFNIFERDLAAGSRMNLYHAEGEFFCRKLHPNLEPGYFNMYVKREGFGLNPAIKMAYAMYLAGKKPILTIENGRLELIKDGQDE